MQKVNRNDPCPCGSGKKYKVCCGLVHAGIRPPEDPETMIRARYTAYAIGNVDFLYRTTHPANEALQGKTAEEYKNETLGYCRKVDFTGLTIQETTPEDETGKSYGVLTVNFQLPNQPEDSFTERSEFVRTDGRLLYLHGTEIG